jgi:HEAT repeat protein
MMLLLLTLLACGPSSDDIARNLESPNPAVRIDTAKIARNFGSDGVEQALIGAIYDQIEQVRVHAIESLAELEAKQAAPALVELLVAEEGSPRVLRATVDTLGRLGDTDAVPAIIAYIEAREKTSPPLNAIWALGHLEDHRALHVLSRLRESSDPYVRWNATEALRNLRPPPAEG